jgi:hypothetical protein
MAGKKRAARLPRPASPEALYPLLSHGTKVPIPCGQLLILCYPVDAVPSAAGYRLGSDRGSPNHGSTLASKRVMAQIRSPARVST